MNETIDGRRKIDHVHDALDVTLRELIARSTKGPVVSSRYRVAMLAYSDMVYDLLDGARSIHHIARLGVPELAPMQGTNTQAGFVQVEKLLERELPLANRCPAPVVCHITDGAFTGEDPEPIVRRIKAMSVPDGNVLVENVFIGDRLLELVPGDVRVWPGVLPNSRLRDEYLEKLKRMSSRLPDSYRQALYEEGYDFHSDAIMLIPAAFPEMIRLGLQMSTSTRGL